MRSRERAKQAYDEILPRVREIATPLSEMTSRQIVRASAVLSRSLAESNGEIEPPATRRERLEVLANYKPDLLAAKAHRALERVEQARQKMEALKRRWRIRSSMYTGADASRVLLEYADAVTDARKILDDAHDHARGLSRDESAFPGYVEYRLTRRVRHEMDEHEVHDSRIDTSPILRMFSALVREYGADHVFYKPPYGDKGGDVAGLPFLPMPWDDESGLKYANAAQLHGRMYVVIPAFDIDHTDRDPPGVYHCPGLLVSFSPEADPLRAFRAIPLSFDGRDAGGYCVYGHVRSRRGELCLGQAEGRVPDALAANEPLIAFDCVTKILIDPEYNIVSGHGRCRWARRQCGSCRRGVSNSGTAAGVCYACCSRCPVCNRVVIPGRGAAVDGVQHHGSCQTRCWETGKRFSAKDCIRSSEGQWVPLSRAVRCALTGRVMSRAYSEQGARMRGAVFDLDWGIPMADGSWISAEFASLFALRHTDASFRDYILERWARTTGLAVWGFTLGQRHSVPGSDDFEVKVGSKRYEPTGDSYDTVVVL